MGALNHRTETLRSYDYLVQDIWLSILSLHCTFSDVRLRGSNGYDGAVQIYFDEHWGFICGQGWNQTAAQVTCRHLGLKGKHKKYNIGMSDRDFVPLGFDFNFFL